MSRSAYNQVFFDRSQQRWAYFRLIIYLLGMILVILFGAMFLSMLHKPALPTPQMAVPNSQLRSAPPAAPEKNSPQSVPATKYSSLFPVGNSKVGVFPPPNQAISTGTGNSVARPKIIGYYVNWDDTSYTSLKSNINTLDELVPEWLHLNDANGGILTDDQAAQDNAMNYISQTRPNLPIVPLINNFDQELQDWNSDMLEKMLANPNARAQTIQNLLEFVSKNKFAGVSVDFESVPDKDQLLLSEFMKELYAKLHPLGLEVTQNIPLNDPAFDPAILSKYTDYLILMAYDEHSIGSDRAGPVASQKWFADSLAARLTQAPPEKYIVALGNYGYDWDASTTDGQVYTFQEAMLSAKDSGARVSFSADSLNPNYDYYDGDTLHHVWFLDATSTFNEVKTMKNFPLHGWALWRLGSEDPSVWKVLQNATSPDLAVASSLRSIDYGYDIDYEGRGEILRVVGSPNSGARDLTFDQRSGLITEENISHYPSPYIVYRWGKNDQKKIALTFDDGPDPNYTPQIISILKNYKANATFFIVGANGTQNQGLLKQIAAEGNEIGNHTFTHPNVTGISDGQFAFELNSTESLLASTIGRHTLLFRPPYAEDIEPVTPEQIRPLLFATKQGYYTVSMHIDPNDWNSPGVDEIVNRVTNGAVQGEGNIVLLHDGGGDRAQTVAALPRIIDGLRAKGFELVTISDLMGVSRESVMPAINSRSRLISKVSAGAYLTTYWGTNFLYFFFIFGIVLGILRFFFITSLAAIQKIRQYFEKYPRYIDKFRPSVAVIIPAYNEERVIKKTVDAVLESHYPNIGIIIVDDGSTDDTLGVLQKYFSANPKVKIFSKPNRGKWAALNFAIERTQAQILVTLDADTIFRPSTIERLVVSFSDLRVGAVAGNTKVGNRKNLLTRLQALEYITSQNLDRRAFDMMNCVTVVPGSVGAWRRKAVIEAGGFSDRTLAEDADLTFSIIRLGYKVTFQARAIAYTEAPDNVRDFIKQRFRWMFGTLQTAWKHKDTMFRPKYGALGFFALPNIFIFQVLFTLISPIMDLSIIASLAWTGWQGFQHPIDYSAFYAIRKLLAYYILFLGVDFFTSAAAFVLEKSEDWRLLFWLIPQRFFYRQLMYFVALKVFFTALKGKIVGWGKFERKATVPSFVPKE